MGDTVRTRERGSDDAIADAVLRVAVIVGSVRGGRAGRFGRSIGSRPASEGMRSWCPPPSTCWPSGRVERT